MIFQNFSSAGQNLHVLKVDSLGPFSLYPHPFHDLLRIITGIAHSYSNSSENWKIIISDFLAKWCKSAYITCKYHKSEKVSESKIKQENSR